MDGDWQFGQVVPLLGRERELAVAISAVATGAGVVIVGPAGVGKTSLATDLSGRQPSPTLFVRASRSLQSVPFGAVSLALASARTVGLGDADAPAQTMDAQGPLTVLRTMHGAVVAFGAGHVPVVFVDDANHLDAPTADLLYHLALGGHAKVIATMRSGVPHPESIHLLWRDGLCQRMQLGALTEGDIGRLAATLLGGEVELDTIHRLFLTVGGNPLYLRELAFDAQHAGTLIQRAGLWSWAGDAGEAPRLTELVSAIAGRLPREHKAVMQALALTGVLPVRVLEQLGDTDTLVSLEARGLITIDHEPGTRHSVARLGHPVFGEVFRPRRGSAQARQRLREVVTGFGEYVTNSVDRLRLAEWRLEADIPIDPHELNELAEVAYHTGHKELSERLARLGIAQLGAAAAARAGVVLGEILVELGRHGEADAVLEPLVSLDLAAPLLSRAIAARLRALAHGMGRFDLAASEVAPHIERVDDPTAQAFVRAQWATVMARDGRFDDAMRMVEPLRNHDDDPVRLRSLPAVNTVLCFTGRIDDAYELASGHVVTALTRRDEVPFGPSWVGAALLTDAMMSGRLVEAEQILDLFQADPLHHVTSNRANFALCHARLAIVRGRARDAVRLATESVSLYALSDPENWRAMAIGTLLEACGHAGDHDAAAPTVQEFLAELTLGSDRVVGLEAQRGAAWAHIAMGDVAAGITASLHVAAESRSVGVPLLEVSCLHDAVRLGAGRATVVELEAAVQEFQGARYRAVHLYARGRLADDPRLLETAAEQFEASTLYLWAAEAFAEAATTYHRQAIEAGARRAAARATALGEHVAGSITPALSQAVEAERLTQRERQIGKLAGDGATSREIADQLHLSVRTVEGHLGRAYDKLGVRSRAELARAMGSSGT